VTALNAWPSFHLGDGTEVDKQIAAPAILALKRGDASAIRSFMTSVLILVPPMTSARSFVELKLS
jgi:hypothetical protein